MKMTLNPVSYNNTDIYADNFEKLWATYVEIRRKNPSLDEVTDFKNKIEILKPVDRKQSILKNELLKDISLFITKEELLEFLNNDL